MKIVKIDRTGIEFDNGATLTHFHDQDCCERVYADWEHIQVLTKIGRNSISTEEMDFEENLTEHIWGLKDVGFTLEDKNGIQLFISCYNQQNGYYSSDLHLIYNNDSITTEIDITKYVRDEIDW